MAVAVLQAKCTKTLYFRHGNNKFLSMLGCFTYSCGLSTQAKGEMELIREVSFTGLWVNDPCAHRYRRCLMGMA